MAVSSENIYDIKKDLKQLISEDNFSKTISVLKSKVTDNDLYNELTIIEFQYTHITKEIRLDKIADPLVAKSKIAVKLIEVIEQLTDDNYELIEKFSKSTEHNVPPLILVIDKDIHPTNEEGIKSLFDTLANYLEDKSLRVLEIKKGSIILKLALSKESTEKILRGIRDGSLKEVLGVNVYKSEDSNSETSSATQKQNDSQESKILELKNRYSNHEDFPLTLSTYLDTSNRVLYIHCVVYTDTANYVNNGINYPWVDQDGAIQIELHIKRDPQIPNFPFKTPVVHQLQLALDEFHLNYNDSTVVRVIVYEENDILGPRKVAESYGHSITSNAATR